MIWLNRFLMLVHILAIATLGYYYAKIGGMMVLGVAIFAVIVVTVSAWLMAETRYYQGYVAGIEWLKKIWQE